MGQNLNFIKKQFIPAFLTLVIIYYAGNNEIQYKAYDSGIVSLKKEVAIPKKDRMDLAVEQEIKNTQDLALGFVPKSRLTTAFQYAEKLRKRDPGKRTAISGVNWVERGPNNFSGRTRAIMVDPNDVTNNTIFAAGVSGGLWRTTNISSTAPNWQPINDFFSNLAITSLCVDPATSATMYFGTGEGWYNTDAIEGDGIWKSIDGGTNWSKTNFSASSYIQKILVHPTTADVYAATRDGIFRSQNGGSSWTKVLGAGAGSTSNRAADLEIAADNTLFASMGIFSTDGVYSSPNGNNGNWTKLNTGGASGFPTSGFERIEIACAPSNANYVYAVAQDASTDGLFDIYKSVDGGSTWSTTAQPFDLDPTITTDFTRGQAWYNLIIAVDPNDEDAVFVGGIDLFKSVNGGSSWQQITHWYGSFGFQNVHADQHAIVFEPGSSSVMYFGNDGGIYRTTNGTTASPTISSRKTGFNITQFYSCDIHPTAYENHFLGGAQDNGSHLFTDYGINSTIEVTGGDGSFCHIDQDEPQYQFTAYVYNNYYRSTNGGESFSTVANGSNNGSFINPSDYDDQGNKMYAAYLNNQYHRWNDPQTGATFDNVTVTQLSGNITHVACSPNTNNRVFFGTDGGRVVQVDNAHSGTSITGNHLNNGTSMPSGTVSCIAVEEGDDTHLLVTYSNYGSNSVWETADGGNTWISVEGNLPDMPVRWATFNPNDPSQAMLATELGVWSTDNLQGGSTDWQPSNNGLANVRTDMLKVRGSDNFLIAATHGRGLYSSDVFTTLRSDFAADLTMTYTGENIQFSDASYKATTWLWNFGDGNTSTLQNPNHSYSSSGLFAVSLTINGGADVETKANYIQILPDLGTPFTLVQGGNFDVNSEYFGSVNISGTPIERGSSVIAGKRGTSSGSFSWVLGIADANYENRTNSELWTPAYNMTNPGTYTLQFYTNYDTENGWDGFRMEYSLDKGTTWASLGSVGGNWYNHANISNTTAFPLNQPYFSGYSGDVFVAKNVDVSSFAGNSSVAFKFVCKSDGSVPDVGVAFDDFTLAGPANGPTPVPVELTTFNGKWRADGIKLNWTTQSEMNNVGFGVQRSVDGKQFSEIGFVNGNGTFVGELNYNFQDENLSYDKYYYKLRQLDLDGGEEYSNTIVLTKNQIQEQGIASVGPNPFKEKFTIHFYEVPSHAVWIELYEISGKQLMIKKFNSNNTRELELNMGDLKLSPGMYLMKIRSGNLVHARRVIKI